jgi:hypothetical protein
MIIYYVNDVPTDLADTIEKYVLSPDIPWSYTISTVSPEVVTNKNNVSDDFIVKDHEMMSHIIYSAGSSVESKSYDVVKHLSDYLINYFENNILYAKLRPLRIVAVMNLPRKTAEGTIQQPHTDINFPSESDEENYYSFLYYPINCDGDTYFFETRENYKNNLIAKSSPIKGTGVLFSPNMNHAGSLPVHSNRRIIINFLFEAL